jgi:hypothetical protein
LLSIVSTSQTGKTIQVDVVDVEVMVVTVDVEVMVVTVDVVRGLDGAETVQMGRGPIPPTDNHRHCAVSV